MLSRLPAIEQKTDAFSRIKAFMCNEESGIVLAPTEEKMLARLIYANALMSERKYTIDQVAEKIKEMHQVTVWTAKSDINNAYTLFSNVTEDYKRYTLKLHIEEIEEQIRKCKNDKSLYAFVPKLMHEKTLAIAKMPVFANVPLRPGPVIIINVIGEAKMPTKDFEVARLEADKLIEMEESKEYIEFEQLNNDKRTTDI